MSSTVTDGPGDGDVQQTFRGTDVKCREVNRGRDRLSYILSTEESMKNGEWWAYQKIKGGPILLK